jgi:hypothetical protein
VLLPKNAKDEQISVRIVTGVGAKYTQEACLKNPELQKEKGVMEPCSKYRS